jgi:hypothetical protein
MTTPAHVNLHFEDSGRWYSLPDWAEYYMRIGRQLASASSTDSRILTAIVVPTRAFGAAFVSLGMVISDAAAHDRASEAAHFEMLFDLPPGTPVIYRPQNGKTLRGILQAPEESNGKIRIRVQVHSTAGGSLTYVIDESKVLRVQPARHSGKLPKKQGSNTRFTNEFVESLLGETDPVQLGVSSKVVCAIVGRKNVLEHEIRHTPLAIDINGQYHIQGQLQDILRVNKFVAPQQSHRSVLVAVGGDAPSSEVEQNTEIGVVYDGAAGFLKWGSSWREGHQVVVLDRTEPYFEDAINAINCRFSQDRISGEDGLIVTEAPPGGEVLSFREALQ